jgi:hypothetical protein
MSASKDSGEDVGGYLLIGTPSLSQRNLAEQMKEKRK